MITTVNGAATIRPSTPPTAAISTIASTVMAGGRETARFCTGGVSK